MSDMYKRFITLEGGEGAGKTTALKTIKEVLESREHPYVFSREPGGTALGQSLRQVLLHDLETPICGAAQAHLFLADRNQHLQEKIIPSLEKGKIFVSDRFADSSIAYQGFGKNIKEAITLNRALLEEYEPGLTLYLNVDPELGLKRANGRSEKDRMEQEDINFHERVRQGFLTLANEFPRYKIIDANQSMSSVQDDIRRVLGSYLDSIEK